MDDIITLDYGSGGKKTAALIDELILPALGNSELNALGDGAILDGALAFSTDSFVVSPLFFPGGDIGKLSVCGTVNDLAMCGAEPKYLSLALIIEEGLPTADLRRIVASIKAAAEGAGVAVVTGDTKVVERGRGDGVYITTSGIGLVKYPGLGPDKIRPGDAVLISGTAGDHGAAVMLARDGLLEGELRSDCAALNGLASALLGSGAAVRVLRDPTRGGAATTLCEFAESAALGIELDEEAIPVRRDVAAACALLGLDPLYCANEGKMLAVVAPEDAEAALATLRSRPEGENAAIIGRVTAERPGKVVLRTRAGEAGYCRSSPARSSRAYVSPQFVKYMSIFENKEVEKMQEYRMTQITKADIVPTALRMRHEGRWLVMIHGQVEPDGRVRVSYDYAVDPAVESYYVLGETTLPSISDIYDEAARWPECELHELMGLEFEGLDTSKRLFLPEDMLETQGKGHILVTPLSELREKRVEQMEKGSEDA